MPISRGRVLVRGGTLCIGWPQAMKCYARCLDVSFPCEYIRLSTGVGHHEELPCWLTPTFHDAFRSHSLAPRSLCLGSTFARSCTRSAPASHIMVLG